MAESTDCSKATKHEVLLLNKRQLRKSAIATLKNFSDEKRHAIEKRLREHLFTTDMWKAANTIGITVSQRFEWNTKPIIEVGWQQGKTMCVPKCIPQEKKLIFYRLDHFSQLEVVYSGLLEPKPEEATQIEKSHIDLLIVPGLLFDKKGFRVGFGGGYYDRFLTDFPNQTVSLMHSSQLVERVPSESFDIPVQQLITENGRLQV